MLDDDRLSASSAESDRDDDQDNNNAEQDNDADEMMEDAYDGADQDADGDDDDNNDDDDDDADNDDDNDDDGEGQGDGDEAGNTSQGVGDSNDQSGVDSKVERSGETSGVSGDEPKQRKSATPGPSTYTKWPVPRPEMISAHVYDIIPTMAAPQSTSVNAMAITPDLRYWITGGSDGYIRKYDGPNTINGKSALTVAQKHPFVDSVTKAGILMSYWENEEPAPPGRGDQEHILSPVYSLAIQADALWLLSGLESGGINLQSVRHDEGKRICCLQQHTNAVSVLTLAQDETSVLSGSWDKNIFDWDLNTGQTIRSFDGNAGQISAIELRPASGAPIPEDADEPLPTTTMTTNNGAPPVNGNFSNRMDESGPEEFKPTFDEGAEAQASPAHESLFGGSDTGSLFGETKEDQPFGHDEDEYGTGAIDMAGHGHDSAMDHSADMASLEATKEPDKDPETQPAPAVQPPEDVMDVDEPVSQSTETAPADVNENETQTQELQSKNIRQQSQTNVDTEISALKRSQSPMIFTSQAATTQDPTQTSPTTFLSAAIDGIIRIWDKRVPDPVARINNRPGVPPWCMGACWSPNGNMIYAGRRNGTVEEFDIHKAKRGWEPERVLKFPAGSGAVSAIRPMVNGRHLVW